MSAASAFVVRDFRVAWSYRFSFFVQSGGLVFSLVSLRFLADLVGGGAPASLDQYGGDYFSFALLGLGINLLAYPAVRSFAAAVRDAQVTGTFEAMLTTRASPVAVVLSGGLYQVATAFLQLAVLVIVGLALSASFQIANVALVAAVLAMTVAAFAGLGLLSAAFTIAFKQREPFTVAVLAASLMISGVLYPTSVLPGWLEQLAPLLPMTHALELVRGLLLEDAGVDALIGHFAALGAFGALLPLGMWSVVRSIAWARRAGSLSHY